MIKPEQFVKALCDRWLVLTDIYLSIEHNILNQNHASLINFSVFIRLANGTHNCIYQIMIVQFFLTTKLLAYLYCKFDNTMAKVVIASLNLELLKLYRLFSTRLKVNVLVCCFSHFFIDNLERSLDLLVWDFLECFCIQTH